MRIKWDVSEIIPELRLAGMGRLKVAAGMIRDEAKRILKSKMKGAPINRPVYKTGKAKGMYWTAREHGAMIKTIRVSTKKGSKARNVWIMAGTDKTWWALQMEYGRGGWQGGRRSFLRPAIKKSIPKIKNYLKNG